LPLWLKNPTDPGLRGVGRRSKMVSSPRAAFLVSGLTSVLASGAFA
jgi:hypothetical protein